jgi:hypothetical protein
MAVITKDLAVKAANFWADYLRDPNKRENEEPEIKGKNLKKIIEEIRENAPARIRPSEERIARFIEELSEIIIRKKPKKDIIEIGSIYSHNVPDEVVEAFDKAGCKGIAWGFFPDRTLMSIDTKNNRVIIHQEPQAKTTILQKSKNSLNLNIPGMQPGNN